MSIREYWFGAYETSPGRFIARYALPNDEKMRTVTDGAGEMIRYHDRKEAELVAARHFLFEINRDIPVMVP